MQNKNPVPSGYTSKKPNWQLIETNDLSNGLKRKIAYYVKLESNLIPLESVVKILLEEINKSLIGKERHIFLYLNEMEIPGMAFAIGLAKNNIIESFSINELAFI